MLIVGAPSLPVSKAVEVKEPNDSMSTSPNEAVMGSGSGKPPPKVLELTEAKRNRFRHFAPVETVSMESRQIGRPAGAPELEA